MAMTSDQINQLISSNAQHFSQQQEQVARQNMLYNISPGPEFNSAQFAGTAGSWAGQIPDAGLTAAGLAADFGYAPRIFSPFSATINAGMAGYATGGLGAGLAMGAATYGVYSAAGSAANYLAIDPFKTGAQTRGMELGFLSQTMPGMSMQQLAPIAFQMEGLNRQGYSTPEITGLMQQGIMGGQIGTNSVSGFQQQFSQLVQETKQVAAVLHTSLNEAYQALEQVKGLGSSNPMATLGAMRGLGQAGGLDPSTMLSIAQGGSSLAKMAGISRDIGINGAMTTAATFGHLGQNKAFGQDFGVQDAGAFQNAAYRFFGSQPGTSALAAMMDSHGNLDEHIAARMANGGISREEINRLASKNRGTDLFQSHNQELVATYLSEYGPGAINNPLQEMTRGTYHQNSRRQGLTGLNNEQLNQLSMLSQNRNQLGMQLQDNAGEFGGNPQLGFGDTIKLALGKMTAPIRDHFSKLGSELAQTIAETTEDITKDFVTKMPTRNDPRGFNQMMQAASMGQTGLVQGYKNFMKLGGPEHMVYGPHDSTRGAFMNLLPSGLTHPGAELSELPNNGWAPTSSGGLRNFGIGVGAMAMAGAGGAGYAGFSGAELLGGGISAIGRGIAPAPYLGPAESGIKGLLGGLRGVGLGRGTLRAASGLTRAAGLAVRGAGAVAGAAGAVYTGWELGSAIGHQINRATLGESADNAHDAEALDMLRAHEMGFFDLKKVAARTSVLDDGVDRIGNVMQGSIREYGRYVRGDGDNYFKPGSGNSYRETTHNTSYVRGDSKAFNSLLTRGSVSHADSVFSGLNADDRDTVRHAFSLGGKGLNTNPALMARLGIDSSVAAGLAQEFHGLIGMQGTTEDGLKNLREDTLERHKGLLGKHAGLVDQTIFDNRAALGDGSQGVGTDVRDKMKAQLMAGGMGIDAAVKIAEGLGAAGSGFYKGMASLRAFKENNMYQGQALQAKNKLRTDWDDGGQAFARHLAASSGIGYAELENVHKELAASDVLGHSAIYDKFAADFAAKHGGDTQAMERFAETSAMSTSEEVQKEGARIGSLAVWTGATKRYGLDKKGSGKHGVAFLEEMLHVNLAGFKHAKNDIAGHSDRWENEAINRIHKEVLSRELAANNNVLTDAVTAKSWAVTNQAMGAARGNKADRDAFALSMSGLPTSAKSPNSDGQNAKLLGEFTGAIDKLKTTLNNFNKRQSNAPD